MAKLPKVGRNSVSVIAILSLTILGFAWAYLGIRQFLYVAIIITSAIAGLGGYSVAKGDFPLPGKGGPGNG